MKLLFTEIAEHCSSIITLKQTVVEPVQNNQMKEISFELCMETVVLLLLLLLISINIVSMHSSNETS